MKNTPINRIRVGLAGLILSVGYALYAVGPTKIAYLSSAISLAIMFDGVIVADIVEEEGPY